MKNLLPAICPQCTLIQNIERPDGICNACHLENEIDAADPLDTFTPQERAEFEAEIAAFQRAELAAAKKIAGPAHGWLREKFENSGRDIVEFTSTESPESAAYVAAACGYHSSTWDEPRNVTRRAKEEKHRATVRRQTAQIVSMVAPKETPQIAPVSSPENWAKSYVAQLAAEHPQAAKKLAKSLEWQLQQLPSLPVTTWQQRAKMAFDAKVRA